MAGAAGKVGSARSESWREYCSPTETPLNPYTPAGSCRHRTAGSCPTESAPRRQTEGCLDRFHPLPTSFPSLSLSRTLEEQDGGIIVTVHTHKN